MKLYYTPGTCALAPHILIREAGLDVEPVRVTFAPEGRTVEGRDYYEINPLGVVPTLALDGGEILTENAVILQYLASLAHDSRFGPPPGGTARWHFLERLHFVATELHKGGFSPLFKPYNQGEPREHLVKALAARFDLVEAILQRQPWLTGEDYSIVDMYAFVTLRWSEGRQVDLSPWPKLADYKARIAARPAVQAAMQEQGLT